MKKLNYHTKTGIGLLTTAILLSRFDLQQNLVMFTQGLSTGLGLTLIFKGFLVSRKISS